MKHICYVALILVLTFAHFFKLCKAKHDTILNKEIQKLNVSVIIV